MLTVLWLFNNSSVNVPSKYVLAGNWGQVGEKRKSGDSQARLGVLTISKTSAQTASGLLQAGPCGAGRTWEEGLCPASRKRISAHVGGTERPTWLQGPWMGLDPKNSTEGNSMEENSSDIGPILFPHSAHPPGSPAVPKPLSFISVKKGKKAPTE